MSAAASSADGKAERSNAGEPGVDAAHPGAPGAVPELPHPPKRHDQDARPVEGGEASDLPRGTREQGQQPVQG